MISVLLKIVLYSKQLYLLFFFFNIINFVPFHTFEQPINIGMCGVCVSLIYCKTWTSISKTSSFSIKKYWRTIHQLLSHQSWPRYKLLGEWQLSWCGLWLSWLQPCLTQMSENKFVTMVHLTPCFLIVREGTILYHPLYQTQCWLDVTSHEVGVLDFYKFSMPLQ